ncbi:hypothetical protein JH06_3715 [Blastocystis sp. subtype 4]|uniref:hypothetical protein n=1 Tax=Blastocystis sp. subtype 4 TaxID=944170 RepID=UPI000711A753|nr:hypothetical protein JH06_3715 [Blastocystis sp. subtype 4]KNB43177.1 hypothetical protein JH06_3715 [Blastocystis sp. subtype 4]|eukprot:XP_014526620.1 hypothetical protein JH06_3715 [Blastocystis sp. subtype 4]
MQGASAQDPIKWDDVVFNDSDDDELISGEMSASLKISKGYRDPLGIVNERVDPQTEDIDYSSEQFNPMRFLLEIHNSTSLQALEKGLDSMRGTVLDEESRLKKLVKDYFGDFVTARKTIEDLEKTLSDPAFFDSEGHLVMENVRDTVKMAEDMIAPLQSNREKIYSLQTSLQLFRKYRLMFPTIDNVEEYLRSKQWDKLLKEYQKYKTTIMDSNESNIVIEMIKTHMMSYIQKAIDELLSLLYNSSSVLTSEQQTHFINVVIGLDYPHVPELFMIQNSLQTWKNSIIFYKEQLLNRRVAVGLLLQYMRDLSSKYLEILKKCMNVLCSMMKRVSDLTSVSESISEIMNHVDTMMTLYQQEVVSEKKNYQ